MWNIHDEIISAANSLKINVKEITEDETKELINKVIKRYTTGKTSGFLWDNINYSYQVRDKDGWQLISDFIGDTESIMFFNNDDEEKSFLFKKGKDLVSVLGETYGYEFYITDKEFNYLLCFNHHDILIASGRAIDWLRDRNKIDDILKDKRKLKDIYDCEYIESEEELYPLQKWYNKLIDKTILEINIADVVRMIRQYEFIYIAVDKAINYLKTNPFDGELYEGQLLGHLFKLDINYLKRYFKDLKAILEDAEIKNKYYEWGFEEERGEFQVLIDKFWLKIRGYNYGN